MGVQPVIPFDELTVDDVEVAGGKGANLGELTQAGLPVPPGFVVTAPAYLEAMDAGGVRGQLQSAAAELDTDDRAALAAAAEHLHDAGPQGRRARRVARAILDAYHRLGGGLRRRAVVGHRGGHRGHLVRRDERDVHQRRRRRGARRRGRRLLGVALRRAGDRLPRHRRASPTSPRSPSSSSAWSTPTARA